MTEDGYTEGHKMGRTMREATPLRNDPHPLSTQYRSSTQTAMWQGGQMSVELGYRDDFDFFKGYLDGLLDNPDPEGSEAHDR
jgi:hypothetical protein